MTDDEYLMKSTSKVKFRFPFPFFSQTVVILFQTAAKSCKILKLIERNDRTFTGSS